MAADDEDNEFDGNGATGDGATGDYGDDNDSGNGRRRRRRRRRRQATKSTLMMTMTTTRGNEVNLEYFSYNVLHVFFFGLTFDTFMVFVS
jgi:hypothetical protein